jgi:hypothetical protein
MTTTFFQDDEFYPEETLPFFKRNLPTIMSSAALHFFVLFVISLMPIDKNKTNQPMEIIIELTQIEVPDEIVKRKEIIVKDTEIDVETDPEEADDPQEDIIEPEDEAEKEDFSDLPDLETDLHIDVSEEISAPTLMSLTSSNASSGGGMPKGYGGRSVRGMLNGIRTKGGAGTVNAVSSALEWLANHQEEDGSWNPKTYEGSGHCTEYSATGIALLPFLGSGHSERTGNYKRTVSNGIKYLNKIVGEQIQEDPGSLQRERGYGAGIVLMALSEACIFGSSSTTRMNANAITECLIDNYKASGWGYKSGGTDLSVSGWIALGLKSAKAAELPVTRTKKFKDVMASYKKWIWETMTIEETGRGRYNPKGGERSSMMFVGMFQRQFLGADRYDKFLLKASENIVEEKLAEKYCPDIMDVYSVYYGTLSAFQQGGQVWNTWNAQMKPGMLNNQCKGSTKEKGGSWNPSKDHTGKHGGRVMMTALCTLCLEVYYRYESML